MSNIKITTSEAIALIITIIVANSVLSLPNDILMTIGSSSLLNIIFITILACIFIYIICKFFNLFPNSDLLDISEYVFNKPFKNILGIIFIIYLLFTSGILLRNFCESLRTIYYPNTDIFFIISFFIISTILTGIIDFNCSLKANLLIIPIIFISIIFLFFSNIQNFSGEKIFPILGNGFKETFIIGIQNIFAFAGITFLYFLPPLLKKQNDFKKIAFSSIIISGLYLLLATSILLFMFPIFFDTDEIMPLFSAARHIQFGTFFQRLESIFLLIWIFTFGCFLSITCKFIILIFSKLTNISKTKFIVSPFALIILAISLIPNNYAVSKFLESEILKYFSIILIFFLSFIILFLGFLKKKYIKGGEKQLIKS